MRKALLFLASTLIIGLSTISIQSQTETLKARSTAFFSNEDDIQLAVNFAGSTDIDIYVNNSWAATIVETHPDVSRILDMNWNSTGNYLAVAISSRAGDQDSWYVWDINTQERILEYQLDFASFVEWHPTDSNRLIVSTGVRVFDADVKTRTIHEAPRIFTNVWQIAWNPLGDYLAILDDQGRVYLLSEADLTVEAEIDEKVTIPERQDYYFSFTWSPEGNQFAVYDMLDTEIEIWNISPLSLETSFSSFDERLQHAEGVVWTSVGLVAYVDTSDIALQNPLTGDIINLINQERSAFFWDEPRQQFLYIPKVTSPTDVTLEILPLLPVCDSTTEKCTSSQV